MIEKQLTLQNKDVNMFSIMRLSRLYEYLQEISILDTEQLGAGEKVTRDHGILWVVVQQRVQIARLPKYGEHVLLSSWPGTCVHVLFPRYYEMKDDHGNVLVKGSALWALMDAETRKVVFPERRHIVVPAEERQSQAPLPVQLKAEETGKKQSFTVPFSWCDMNGHMNNARYLDLGDDLLVHLQKGIIPMEISCEYRSEARLHQQIEAAWNEDEDHAYVQLNHERCICRILLAYDHGTRRKNSL
ncbi:MAG: acyl-ACP thioesterase domain-containing protein [Lactimicrobium sp.]|jgi:medium-chain acyl-[acyl-carrier-protein] hydrolase|uniref:acyl-[acyl-carrier-protein] thioesterase n=1 Tax=Lactimicrobium sp. TaxID=2563780 RepID=UPI002F35D8A3